MKASQAVHLFVRCRPFNPKISALSHVLHDLSEQVYHHPPSSFDIVIQILHFCEYPSILWFAAVSWQKHPIFQQTTNLWTDLRGVY